MIVSAYKDEFICTITEVTWKVGEPTLKGINNAAGQAIVIYYLLQELKNVETQLKKPTIKNMA